MAQVLEVQGRIYGIRKNKKLKVMVSFDDVTGKIKQEHHPNWFQYSWRL